MIELKQNFYESAKSGEFFAEELLQTRYIERYNYWCIQLDGVRNGEFTCIYNDFDDPIEFLAILFASLNRGISVCLGSSHWGMNEKQSIFPFLTHMVVKDELVVNAEFNAEITCLEMPEIWIKTGGSSGEIKFSRHRLDSLLTAVWGWLLFLDHEHCIPDCIFETSHDSTKHLRWDRKILEASHSDQQLNSWITLPLFHVSGLMACFRSMATRGKIFFKSLQEMGSLPANYISEKFWLSLVPAQIHKLIESPKDCNLLSKLRGILVGGSALSLEMADKCRIHQLPLYLCYGMTETAAMVCALPKKYFLRGTHSVGFPLAHVELELGKHLCVKTDSLSLGLVDSIIKFQGLIQTTDLYTYEESKGLIITGRANDMINTGGEKVNPMEIEVVLKRIFQSGVVVVGIEDEHWGEQIAALIEGDSRDILENELDGLKEKFSRDCAGWKFPKKIVFCNKLKINEIGKMDRLELKRIVKNSKNSLKKT